MLIDHEVNDLAISEVLKNHFPEELLSLEYTYLTDRLLSQKERILLEHLCEGYKDDYIFNLCIKEFKTKSGYKSTKNRLKKKILHFFGI